MGYKNLEIWKKSRDLVVEIHSLTIYDIPKFEMFETGSQIRRSMKSVKANIVEGYGRQRYKLEYIHFLTIAEASLDETIDHLETLFETKSLEDTDKYTSLHERLHELAKMLNSFIRSVEKNYIPKH